MRAKSGMKDWLVLHTGLKYVVSDKNKTLFLVDGILINAAFSLTIGVMMSGYALHLGANDFITTIINNSSNYATILSLFSFLIFERMTRRKKMLLALNFLSRSMIFLVIFLPFVFRVKGAIMVFLCILVIGSDIIWGIYRVGWLVWMVQSVQQESRNEYIFFRMLLIRIFSAILVFGSGVVLDYFNKGYTGFLIVFTASYVLSITDLVILKGIDDVECNLTTEKNQRIKRFFEPLKAVDYRSFMVFTILMFLIYTMSTCFTSVYLLKYLKFGYKYISVANLVSIVAIIISNRFWTKLDGSKGTDFVIGLISVLIAFELLLLTFLNSNTAFLYIFSSALSGAGMGGFIVSSMAYRYKIMPENERTLYEGWYFFAYGFGMLLAPFAGKFLLNILKSTNIATGEWNVFRLLYGISTILVLVLLFVRQLNIRKNEGMKSNFNKQYL